MAEGDSAAAVEVAVGAAAAETAVFVATVCLRRAFRLKEYHDSFRRAFTEQLLPGLFRQGEIISGMAKQVCVQVKNVAEPVRLTADKAEWTTVTIRGTPVLSLSLGGNPVGEFRSDSIDGWWYEEADAPPVPMKLGLGRHVGATRPENAPKRPRSR